jgi:copper chaperone CopZ
MKIQIEGMHCQACVARVERALGKVDGVSVKRVEVGSAELDADAALEPKVLAAVRDAGFEPKKESS